MLPKTKPSDKDRIVPTEPTLFRELERRGWVHPMSQQPKRPARPRPKKRK